MTQATVDRATLVAHVISIINQTDDLSQRTEKHNNEDYGTMVHPFYGPMPSHFGSRRRPAFGPSDFDTIRRRALSILNTVPRIPMYADDFLGKKIQGYGVDRSTVPKLVHVTIVASTVTPPIKPTGRSKKPASTEPTVKHETSKYWCRVSVEYSNISKEKAFVTLTALPSEYDTGSGRVVAFALEELQGNKLVVLKKPAYHDEDFSRSDTYTLEM